MVLITMLETGTSLAQVIGKIIVCNFINSGLKNDLPL